MSATDIPLSRALLEKLMFVHLVRTEYTFK